MTAASPAAGAAAVAKVRPASLSSRSGGVARLTETSTAVQTANSRIAKWRKLMSAYQNSSPLCEPLVSSSTSRPMPSTKPVSSEAIAPFALTRFQNTPSRKTAAIGGEM
jgi:hypothetical protein